jgi:hypothetical protein
MTKKAHLFIIASLAIIGCASPCESESGLKELARESVSSKLKAPSTAKFSNETVKPAKDGDGMLVEGNVEAQNSFGAPIQEDYTIVAKCLDGKPIVAWAWMGTNSWGTEHQAMLDSIYAE